MLKEQQNNLILKLKGIIKEIGYINDIKQDVVAEFKSRNLNGLRAAWALSENLDLNTLTDSEQDIRFLFLFSLALNRALKEKEINISIDVKDYFTELECQQWTYYREEIEEKDILPIIIENVQRVSNKLWQGIMSIQRMGKISKANIIIYNFSTQRDPIITAYGERINIDKNKINEIKERMLNDEQYSDPIILNILNDGESKVTFNEKNNTLIIHEGSKINIIDGFHRKTASDLALEENPNLQFNWQVTFTFLSEKDAHDYMRQKDKQKPIKKEWIDQKDYSRSENLVIDVIMDNRLSELAKVMKDDDQYIKLNRALTKKSIISEAIKECYTEDLKTSINIRKIGKWIVEFTDYLMGTYAEEFIANPYTIKETSFINNKNMFYGYIALSKQLQSNSKWEELMMQKIESIDFSIGNKLWKDIGLLNNKNKDASKVLRNKLYKLFTEEGV